MLSLFVLSAFAEPSGSTLERGPRERTKRPAVEVITDAVKGVAQPLWTDRRHHSGFSPVVDLNFNLSPILGVEWFHRDLGNGENLSVVGAFGGVQLFEVGVDWQAARTGGSPVWTQAAVRYDRTNGAAYAGLGSAPAPLTRFSQHRSLAVLGAGVTAGERDQVQLGVTGIVNRRTFDTESAGRQPSVDAHYDTSGLPGFDDGVTTTEVDFVLTLDGRQNQGIRAPGGRLQFFGGPVHSSIGPSFVHYGVEGAVTLDLFHGNRLLRLRAFADAVDGEDGTIPFTSLPRLGGADRVRGYLSGRYRDRRAMGATISYSHPIRRHIQAMAFFDLGTVAPTWADVVHARLLPGVGLGMLVGDSNSIKLRGEVSYGDSLQLTLSTDIPLAFAGRRKEL